MYATVLEWVFRFFSVCADACQLLKTWNYLESPQKWTFCTIFFRWLNPFQHSGVAAAGRGGSNLNNYDDFRTENGSSQGQNLVLTGLVCSKFARQRV